MNTQGLVTFRVNRDMTYSGNNVVTATPDASFETYGYETKSGDGFLFLDRNAQATFDIADGKRSRLAKQAQQAIWTRLPVRI